MDPKTAIDKLNQAGKSALWIAGQLNIAPREIMRIQKGQDGNRWLLGEKIIALARNELKEVA
jgi:hypothetical protein